MPRDLIDARDVPNHVGGEYVMRLTMYGEDGSVIRKKIVAWSSGFTLMVADLRGVGGQPVFAIRVEPMFRPDGAR